MLSGIPVRYQVSRLALEVENGRERSFKNSGY